MSGTCQNGSCPRLANLTARWAMVGDRQFCRACFESLKALVGDDMRELTIAEQPTPAWARRSLARVFES